MPFLRFQYASVLLLLLLGSGLVLGDETAICKPIAESSLPVRAIAAIEHWLNSNSSDSEQITTIFDWKPLKGVDTAAACNEMSGPEFIQDIKYKNANKSETDQYLKDVNAFLKSKASMRSVFLQGLVIQFRAKCSANDSTKETLDFIAGCQRELGEASPCIRYSYRLPDKNQAQLQRNVIYHELGHIVLDQLAAFERVQPDKAVSEAFSDFFAYSISKDPNIGLYFNKRSNQMEYLRKMRVNDFSKSPINAPDWGFSQLSKDPYASPLSKKGPLLLT